MHHYYHFYKPVGCVSARKDAEHTTVMDYFPSELRDTLFPLGRLDKTTEGLLLITDDGKLNHRLLDPENHIKKRSKPILEQSKLGFYPATLTNLSKLCWKKCRRGSGD